MTTKLIAIPSVLPGGMNSKRSGHFGMCDVFTLISIQDGQVAGVQIVENTETGDLQCQAPVEMLLTKGVDTLIVNNLGQKPFSLLKAAGVEVLLGRGLTVKAVVDNYLAGRLEPLTEEYVCEGQEHPYGYCQA